MEWRQKQTLQGWEQWVNTEQWEVFGTLNFSSLHHLRRANRDDVCGKMWRSYFGAVDRALYGQQRKDQRRFDRAVFVQYGSNNDYPHVHFLAKSPLPTTQFCTLLNAVWGSMYSSSARPKSNEITPIIEQAQTTGYGLHEFFELNSTTYDYRLSHLSPLNFHPCVRDDAVDRLGTLTTKINLTKATLEYPNHVQAAQARREKRVAAAMLRR